jgi:ketosteroid isomerase-like protein
MSEENVDLVRRATEAWNEIGPESIKQFWAEDAEWHDPPNLPDSRVVRGRDGIASYQDDQVGVVGRLKLTIVDVRARDEMVVQWVGLTVHGVESGVDVPGEMAQVYEVADGRIHRIRLFFAWEEALEAAGLSE